METPYRYTIEPTGRRAAKAWKLTVRGPRGKTVRYFESEEAAADFLVREQIGTPEQFLERLWRDLPDEDA